MKFALEKISDEFLDSLVPLVVENFNETAVFKDLKLEPDLSAYYKAEEAGVLRIYTVREDAKLVGYSIFSVFMHNHFRGTKVAKEEVIFLAPEHRKGRVGLKFIDYCDEALTAEGVNIIMRTSTEIRDWSPVLLRRGYVLAEKTYAKRVGG